MRIKGSWYILQTKYRFEGVLKYIGGRIILRTNDCICWIPSSVSLISGRTELGEDISLFNSTVINPNELHVEYMIKGKKVIDLSSIKLNKAVVRGAEGWFTKSLRLDTLVKERQGQLKDKPEVETVNMENFSLDIHPNEGLLVFKNDNGCRFEELVDKMDIFFSLVAFLTKRDYYATSIEIDNKYVIYLSKELSEPNVFAKHGVRGLHYNDLFLKEDIEFKDIFTKWNKLIENKKYRFLILRTIPVFTIEDVPYHIIFFIAVSNIEGIYKLLHPRLQAYNSIYLSEIITSLSDKYKVEFGFGLSESEISEVVSYRNLNGHAFRRFRRDYEYIDYNLKKISFLIKAFDIELLKRLGISVNLIKGN